MTIAYQARQVRLANGAAIAATGALDWKAILPQWHKNMRFFALIEDLVTTGSPTIEISIEHSLNRANPFDLYNGFSFSAAGAQRVYNEDLATQHPFDSLRANILTLTNVTSMKLTIVGQGDRSY
jgi:hypothetical protein